MYNSAGESVGVALLKNNNDITEGEHPPYASTIANFEESAGSALTKKKNEITEDEHPSCTPSLKMPPVIRTKITQVNYGYGVIYYLSGFTGIIITCILVSGYALIPCHNHLEEPYFWYEYLLQTILIIVPFKLSINAIAFFTWIYQFDYVKNWNSFLFIVALDMAWYIIYSLLYYCIWVIFLGYSAPLPLNFLILNTIGFWSMMGMIWLRIPQDVKESAGFRKRFLKFYVGNGLSHCTFGVWGYFLLNMSFVWIQRDYQWIIGIFGPFMREFEIWQFEYLSNLAATDNPQTRNLCRRHYMETRHCMFIAVNLAAIATDATTYLILGIDFAINMFQALKIAYNMKYRNHSYEDEKIMIEQLVITERSEVITPIIYIIVVAISYYGPNANIIGGIGATVWHLVKIKDINAYFTTLFLMVGIDFASLILSGAILWFACNINILKVYQKIQHDLWFFLACIEFSVFIEMFGALLIGSGMDFSFKFNWIDGKYVVNNTNPRHFMPFFD